MICVGTFCLKLPRLNSRRFAVKMDPKSARQVSSAGYRFPERPKETRPATSRSGGHHDPGEVGALVSDRDWKNPVVQDELWKDLVSKERKIAQQW